MASLVNRLSEELAESERLTVEVKRALGAIGRDV
jgi:hypothetical protein